MVTSIIIKWSIVCIFPGLIFGQIVELFVKSNGFLKLFPSLGGLAKIAVCFGLLSTTVCSYLPAGVVS